MSTFYKRDRPNDQSWDGTKRFRGTSFPAEIQALPHVRTQLDRLLMAPEEAIVEAATSGESAWLGQLLKRYTCSIPSALVPAAANGHLDCGSGSGNSLLDESVRRWEIWECLRRALVAASATDDINTMKLLWETFNPLKHAPLGAHSTVVVILEDAAENGRLRVVKFVVQDAVDANYAEFVRPSGALARAISGRQADVVEFLLGLDASWWDVVGAFVSALGTGQHALADRVFNVYRETHKAVPLLVELTCHRGWTNAVKYLYNRGENDPKVASEAFVSAASYGFIDTAEFLLGTNRVLPDAVSDAVVVAAASPLSNIHTMKFLCSTKQATPSSIDRAFVATSSVKLLRFLYENEGVSDEAIVTVFKNASGWGRDCSFFRFDARRIEIVKLLYQDSRVPGDVVGRALVQAACSNQAEVVALLLHDTRISAELRSEAFAMAALYENGDLMVSLFDKQRTSPDAIWAAMSSASFCCPTNLKILVELIFNDDDVPRKLKRWIIGRAVETRLEKVLRVLEESGWEDWSLATMENVACTQVSNSA